MWVNIHVCTKKLVTGKIVILHIALAMFRLAMPQVHNTAIQLLTPPPLALYRDPSTHHLDG